jgi:hypothetical protein
LAKLRRSSRLTSRNLGEPIHNRPFTLPLGSTSCGNRPVRRAKILEEFQKDFGSISLALNSLARLSARSFRATRPSAAMKASSL